MGFWLNIDSTQICGYCVPVVKLRQMKYVPFERAPSQAGATPWCGARWTGGFYLGCLMGVFVCLSTTPARVYDWSCFFNDRFTSKLSYMKAMEWEMASACEVKRSTSGELMNMMIEVMDIYWIWWIWYSLVWQDGEHIKTRLDYHYYSSTYPRRSKMIFGGGQLVRLWHLLASINQLKNNKKWRAHRWGLRSPAKRPTDEGSRWRTRGGWIVLSKT
jgi:hypothetical protein